MIEAIVKVRIMEVCGMKVEIEEVGEEKRERRERRQRLCVCCEERQ